MQSRKTKEHNNVDWRTRKKLKEEGHWQEQWKWEGGIWYLGAKPRWRQEERCLNSTGWADKEPVWNRKRGKKGKKWVNNTWRRKGRNTTKVHRSKKGEGVKSKQMQGKRVRKAQTDLMAQVGRISSRGSYRRMALGNGTTNTVWGRRIEVGAPKRAVASHRYWEGCLLSVRRHYFL